jgi:predicted nucleic acid-binding protein
MNLAIVPAFTLIDEASRIAVDYRRSFYDSIYIALATTSNSRMVTADEKLCNAMRGTLLEMRVIMLSNGTITND